MELKADLPYPSTEEVGENCRMLRILSPAYAGRSGELTAVLQYVYQSVYLGARGEERLARLLLSVAINEMRHVEILGRLITRLGAPPVFTACPPYPVGFYSAANVNYVKDVKGMLSADVADEERAIAQYTQMLCNLSSPVREAVSRIIEDEKVHLNTLKEELFLRKQPVRTPFCNSAQNDDR